MKISMSMDEFHELVRPVLTEKFSDALKGEGTPFEMDIDFTLKNGEDDIEQMYGVDRVDIEIK